MKPTMVDTLIKFIIERQRVYERRESRRSKPWTKDPILLDYRFCNIYREQDTVTRWIAENWREPHSADEDLWFALFVARYINLPSTLKDLGYPVPWKPEKWLRIANMRIDANLRVFNAAYVIPPTAGTSKGGTTVGGPKHESISKFFDMLWANRKELRPSALKSMDRSLGAYCDKLVALPGVGTFMAGQVIADLKYAYGGALWKAVDWWEFAVSGPGSRRGLNRVSGNPTDTPWKEFEWFQKLNDLRAVVNAKVRRHGMPKLHGQDMQNSLCEFDKYCRVLLKEGKQPKQRYNGRG